MTDDRGKPVVSALGGTVDEHMSIVRTYVEQQQAEGGQSRRRGLERVVRQRALELADRLNDHGVALDEAAQRLGIKPRTLRHWEQLLRQDNGIALLGRPPADSGAQRRQSVVDYLQSNGPGVSVPALRVQFPDLARAELDRLAKGYREVWREGNRRELRVLHWQVAGTVWAMDFAEAPSLIDGIYPYLLAVRDLASGKQLLWKPVLAESAEVLRAALESLFGAYGVPWVLKSDNGPAFRAEATKRLLRRWGAFALFSPPHMPSYNGAIEAAIGSLKTRTQQLALLDGQPGCWTTGLAELARRQANETARPRRLHGLTPDEAWDRRARLRADDRAAFRASVQQYQWEEWQKQEPLAQDQPDHWTEATVDRVALRRALVVHELLLFTRRSIPARIERPKVAIKG
jgi:transposase InsO family protein